MILVIGKGHLGRIIADYFDANLFDGRLETVPDLQIDYATHIINAAGKTDLAWCEENQVEASHVNSYLPVQLARKAKRFGTHFIQLSSGCVWNGPYDKDNKPFTPNSEPSPACHYATTKVGCDEALLREIPVPGNRIAILRLRMPYSEVKSNRNLFTKLLGYKELIDTPNSITSATVLCETIKKLIDDSLCQLWNRITCVYDKGMATPYQIGVKLHHAGLRSLPERLTKNKLDAFHKPQRVDTVMHDSLFEEIMAPRPVGEMLDETLMKFKSS